MEHQKVRPGSAGEHVLQARFDAQGRADKFYDEQVLDHLNDAMREFLGSQEMVFVATSDSYGECDCSFRSGPPGFVRAIDERTLAYPEYRGNGVMASMGNIFENAQVGLLFVDFFRYRIGLHVNGSAGVLESAEMRDTYPRAAGKGDGPAPERWVVVTVHEAYIHCSKHIPLLAKAPGEHDCAGGVKRNGGDFFGVKAGRKTEAAEAVADAT